MRTTSRWECFGIAICTCVLALVGIFFIVLVATEDEPPEHTADWAIEVGIPVSKNMYEDVLNCAQSYKQHIQLITIAYRLNGQGTFFRKEYSFYFEGENKEPNGTLMVAVDSEAERIVRVAAIHTEETFSSDDLTIDMANRIEEAFIKKIHEFSNQKEPADEYIVIIGTDFVSIEAYQYKQSSEAFSKKTSWRMMYDVDIKEDNQIVLNEAENSV